MVRAKHVGTTLPLSAEPSPLDKIPAMLLTCARAGMGERIPSHGSTSPTGKSSRQELTPFHGKCRNQIQLKARKQELSYRNEGEQLSGQSRGAACSLLAGGSEDIKVFSSPKTYTFIFKDVPLRRALFLQEQIPTSAEKLFQETVPSLLQGNLEAEGPAEHLPHICMGEKCSLHAG